MRINYVVFRIGRKLILIAEQWYKWHGDIIDSKHVITLYRSFNRTSRKVSPCDKLSSMLICVRKGTVRGVAPPCRDNQIGRASSAAVLNSSPRAPPPPPLCIFWKSILVNTPDSYNQLVRSALRAWTVFRLTCSLHRVHCSLLHEQMKSIKVYFTSELSFMDLHCATYSRTDECDIIYLCKYIQFKFTSRTLQCTLNGCTLYKFASNWNHVGISCDVHFAGHLRSNRTNFWSNKSNIRNVQSGGGLGRENWNWEPLI